MYYNLALFFSVHMLIRKAVFVKSASKLEECPATDIPEFAFIGRSNVGKSSLVNTIANNSKLSKISVTPGKTKLISYFLINDAWHLVDLPGYGYAKSGMEERRHRMDVTYSYFLGRKSLKKVFVLLDGNLPPQKIDFEFLTGLDEENIPFDIILTKIDKSTQKESSRNLRLLKEKLVATISFVPKIFPVSNVSKRGKEKLLEYIETQLI